MTSRDFCYWLQGLFELGDPAQLDAKQTALIKQHITMVFLHEIDPSAGSAAHQAELNAAHQGKPKPQSSGHPLGYPDGPLHDGVILRC